MSHKYTLFMLLSSLTFLPSCWQQEEPVTLEIEEVEQAVAQPATKQGSFGKSIHLEELVNNKNEAPDTLRKHAAQGKVVVDFYAKWCPPCKMMLPIIDELAQKYDDISFVKIDIDKFIDLSNGFDVAGKRIVISGVPAFYLFKDGNIVEEIGGGMAKENFEQIMNNAFNN